MGDIRSEFDSIFRHMTTYKIIVCRACKFAVVPGQIERHLREHHPQVEKGKRNRVAKAGAGLESVAHTKEEVGYPQPTDEPVEGLPVYEDGLRCAGQREGTGMPCGYICRTGYGIQKHCRTSHG